MVQTVYNVGDLPETPFVYEQAYLPDQLIAGTFPLVTYTPTIAQQSSVLQRGTILGQQTLGSAVATAAGGNTGNATLSAVALQGTKTAVGTYKVIYTAAGTFSVFDPAGRELKNGANGAAYADDIAFTATAGATPMVAGDSFNVVVSAGTGYYTPAIATATDGSEIPCAILADQCDATAGAVTAGIYQTGEFNINAVIVDASFGSAVNVQSQLAKSSIFLKSSVSAADPT